MPQLVPSLQTRKPSSPECKYTSDMEDDLASNLVICCRIMISPASPLRRDGLLRQCFDLFDQEFPLVDELFVVCPVLQKVREKG